MNNAKSRLRRLKALAIWLDTTRRGKITVTVSSLVLAGLSAIYKIEWFALYKEMVATAFMGIFLMAIFQYLLVLVFHSRYGLNYLVYNRDTGVLYDKNLNILNVSLRRETLRMIIASCPCEKSADREICVKSIGKKVGVDFVREYKGHYPSDRGPLSEREFLETIFEYDSSSGMGKFELQHMDGRPDEYCSILIKNPFTNNPDGERLHSFLAGYLEGILEEIISTRKFECEISSDRDYKVNTDPALLIRVKEKR